MSRGRHLIVSLALAAGNVLAQSSAASSKLTTLWRFSSTDGAQPDGTLIQDASGALYGTTLHGGASGLGEVFQLTPPATGATGWTLHVLHSFAGGSDGANTLAPVVFDKQGALYGTTINGGASGDGTVFRLTPPAAAGGAWTESIIHNFTGSPTGGSDGASPFCGLVFDTGDSLYGTTFAGGASGGGIVFKLTPTDPTGSAWQETVLYNLPGTFGGGSFAGVVFDGAGAIYGTTSGGGAYNLGTVFRLAPPTTPTGAWRGSVLHSFGNGTDGNAPYDTPVFDHGSLYGTTFGGGLGYGTVFELTPPSGAGGAWSETVLHMFAAGSDGAFPFASLVFGPDGLLLSTAAFGGAKNGGIVFGLRPPPSPGGTWTEHLLQNLSSLAQPGATLTPTGKGVFYGLTYGGSPPDYGTVFQLTL